MFAGIKKRLSFARATDASLAGGFEEFAYALSGKSSDSVNNRMIRLFKVLESGAQADSQTASLGFVCAVNNLERMHKAASFGQKPA